MKLDLRLDLDGLHSSFYVMNQCQVSLFGTKRERKMEEVRRRQDLLYIHKVTYVDSVGFWVTFQELPCQKWYFRLFVKQWEESEEMDLGWVILRRWQPLLLRIAIKCLFCIEPTAVSEVPSSSWSWPLTCLWLEDEQKGGVPVQINNKLHYHFKENFLYVYCRRWKLHYCTLNPSIL